MKKVAAIQSNYLPWKGYFDIINMADEFVLYDDISYSKNSWRNRNIIKSHQGLIWLTIPVRIENSMQKINEVKVVDFKWEKKHWTSITQNYSKARYFEEYREIFESLYSDRNEAFLSMINYRFILTINKLLGIKTKISWLTDYDVEEGKNERLISLLNKMHATEYISGPSAKSYINEKLFEKNGISIKWMDYSGYPVYHQLFPPFIHEVSIIDLIFNEGPNARYYLKSIQ